MTTTLEGEGVVEIENQTSLGAYNINIDDETYVSWVRITSYFILFCPSSPMAHDAHSRDSSGIETGSAAHAMNLRIGKHDYKQFVSKCGQGKKNPKA